MLAPNGTTPRLPPVDRESVFFAYAEEYLVDVKFVSRPDWRRSYSITSSARASSVGGISRPSALAVDRLFRFSRAPRGGSAHTRPDESIPPDGRCRAQPLFAYAAPATLACSASSKGRAMRLGRPPIADKLAERIRTALAGGMSVGTKMPRA